MDNIYFDIDKTLINTSEMRIGIHQALSESFSVSLEDLKNMNDAYTASLEKYTDFSPETLSVFLAEKLDVSSPDVLATITASKNYDPQKILYPETIEVLESLMISHSLGVYSEANLNWQQFKLEQTGLTKYFQPQLIHIERRKETPEAVAKIAQNAIYIDDNQRVVSFVAQQRPDIDLYWIDRLNRTNKQVPETVKIIRSLTELVQELV